MLGGLPETLLPARHRPDLAGQADLAEDRQAAIERAIAQAGQHRGEQGEVGRRLVDPHPADHVQEHVLVVGGDAVVAVQHRQQHRQATHVQAQTDAPRHRGVALVDQRLNLDQQRPGALAGDQYHAARGLAAVARQEDRRGVADGAQAALGHGEDAELVDGAEAVLDRPQHPKAAARLALEVEHRVDHVLQHPRPGDGALAGDMADQEQDGAAGLGEAHQPRGALAYLGDRAGGRLQGLGVDRLDRVDDDDPRLFMRGAVEDGLDAGLGQQPQAIRSQLQAMGAHGDLGQ